VVAALVELGGPVTCCAAADATAGKETMETTPNSSAANVPVFPRSLIIFRVPCLQNKKVK